MREISATIITKAIRDMYIEANHGLAPDMREVFEKVIEGEKSPLGRQVLEQFKENSRIAGEDSIPICRDIGMAMVFTKIGQDVCITGERLVDTVSEGVRQGYKQGYLHRSVVGGPIERISTKDNTPVVIRCEITDGEQIDITAVPKRFENGNIGRVFMLKPVDGLEGVKKPILQAVRETRPGTCPSMVVGMGIDGAFERYAQVAKHVPTRDIRNKPEEQWARELEEDMLKRTNQSDIDPGGLGGRVITFAVSIEIFTAHIVDLPPAVNICCHVNRRARRVL